MSAAPRLPAARRPAHSLPLASRAPVSDNLCSFQNHNIFESCDLFKDIIVLKYFEISQRRIFNSSFLHFIMIIYYKLFLVVVVRPLWTK